MLEVGDDFLVDAALFEGALDRLVQGPVFVDVVGELH